jgi:hypothetical protein
MPIEDKLVSGWKNEERRSLMDIFTGGKYKTSSDVPPLSTTGKVTPQNLEWIYKRFFPDERPDFRGGPGAALEAVSPAGIVRKANTASKMFTGWADNLTSYINTLSKKKGKKLKGVLKRAFDDLYGVIDSEDINQVQQSLLKINKDNDLHKFVQVPEITTEGIAGGAARQAKKVKGSTISKSQQTINRQSRDLANERRLRAEQKRIDKGFERGSKRSGKK